MKKLISALLLVFAISFVVTGCKKEAAVEVPAVPAVEEVKDAAPAAPAAEVKKDVKK